MKINKKKQLIIVISSPSGAGKTSVCQKLIENDKFIGLSISDTTRPARANELNGKDYNFISRKKFTENISNGAYIEHAYVFGNYYGSSYQNIINHFEYGRDVLFDIDWQGAKQLKDSPYSNIVSIFIIPPSKDVIYERLKQRAIKSGDNEESINIRMDEYETEMSHKKEYDYIVVNDSLEKCVGQIKDIIDKHRDN